MAGQCPRAAQRDQPGLHHGAIELADGWHDITECELVQFAVGESHSPITPSKLYPALRYKNEFSKLVRTPLNKVLSFSEEPQNRR